LPAPLRPTLASACATLLCGRRPPPPTSTALPYTTLFRSLAARRFRRARAQGREAGQARRTARMAAAQAGRAAVVEDDGAQQACQDRKSTRLNSSHVKNSYAGFCWKKKSRGAVEGGRRGHG